VFSHYNTFIILAVITLSFLTGSKGSAILIVAYSILFTYAAFPRAFSIRLRLVIVVTMALGSLGYVYSLSQVLRIDFGDMLTETLSRFVLSADARLMAFDPGINQYVLRQPHGSLLSELFHGIALLVGARVSEFPFGVYQYEALTGIKSYVGSTSQLSALFVVYGDGGYYTFCALTVIVLCAAVTYRCFLKLIRSADTALGWFAAAALPALLMYFQGGFDAYPQQVEVYIVLFFGFVLFRNLQRYNPLLKLPQHFET